MDENYVLIVDEFFNTCALKFYMIFNIVYPCFLKLVHGIALWQQRSLPTLRMEKGLKLMTVSTLHVKLGIL